MLSDKQSPDAGAPPWRVWVLEDDAETREFFVGSLQAHSSFEVVGQAGTVRQALAELADTPLAPDVLLTDLRLPDGSGLQVMAEALRRFPQCDCLIITVFADVDSILESIQAGAVGYILKDVSAAELVEAVLTVKAGGASMTPLIARRMLAAYREAPGSLAADTPDEAPDAQETEDASGSLTLSPREQNVLSMLSRGFSYREIASLLDVSVNTVQSHIKSLYRKLAVRSRGEAVFEASRLGLLTIGK